MKMIIISLDGSSRDFDFDELAEFHHWLFACLAGIPKKVTIEVQDFSEIYKIEYA